MTTQTLVQAKQILAQMSKQITSQMGKQLGVAPQLWTVPWSTYSQGAHTPSLPAGLVFTRASTQYLRQDVGGGVAYASGTAANNVPVVGTIGAVTGLLLDGVHTNFISPVGRGAQMATSPWTVGGTPAVIGAAAGIDGIAGDGSQFAAANGGFCNYLPTAADVVLNAGSTVAYCHAKPVGSAIPWRFNAEYENGTLVIPAGGTLTDGVWQIINAPITVSNGTQPLGGVTYIIPAEGRAVGSFSAAAQGPYLLDMAEFCVNSHIPLTWHDSTMAGIGIRQSDPTQTIRNGTLDIQIDVNIPYPLAESNEASLPLWAAESDVTTFVNFDTTKGQLRSSVGGVEVLFPVNLLALITTTNVVRFRVASGNGAPVASYALSTDGGVTFSAPTSLGTVSTTQPAIVMGAGALDFGSVGTTTQAEGVHVTWAVFGVGSTPYAPQTARYAAVVATGTGDGLTPGNAATLTNALASARAALTGSNTVILYLRGGTYFLSTQLGGPLALLESDAGLEIWSYPGETSELSGAVPITGWSVYSGSIYQATVPSGSRTTHITVNGKRAQMAGFSGLTDLGGYTVTSTGFTGPSTTYHEPSAAYLYSAFDWKSFFVPISTYVGTTITANTNAWNSANFQTLGASPSNVWSIAGTFGVANVRENIANPGDFAIEPTHALVYYQVRAGDVMSSADARLPVLDTIVTAIGTQGSPVANIQFHGVVFSDTTAADALTNGWSPLQASVQGRGTQGVSEAYSTLPGAVSMIYATDFVFAGCQFLRTGGIGIRADKGCKRTLIIGSTFSQMGGAGATFGWVLQANQRPSNSADEVSLNTITSCTFNNTGLAWWASCAVEGYFIDNLVCVHCTVDNSSYTGFSIGWGWGYAENGGLNGRGWPTDQPPASGDTVCSTNTVTACYFTGVGYTGVFSDGGNIYTVGKQPGSTVSANYVLATNASLRPFYSDNASEGWLWTENIAVMAPLVATYSISQTFDPPAVGNSWINNYSTDSSFFGGQASGNTYINNQASITPPYPSDAQATIAGAGR